MRKFTALLVLAGLFMLAVSAFAEVAKSAGPLPNGIIKVRVVKDTYFFNRKLRVVPLDVNSGVPDVFTINVPKGARVLKHGENISVHQIRVGDVVTAQGSWNKSVFQAPSLRVNENVSYLDAGRNYEALQGRIEKIDYGRNEFSLRSEKSDLTVYADRARVWTGNEVDALKSLKAGDVVMVRGNVQGSCVDAERIEVFKGSSLVGAN
jgi:hypothetical protein